MNLKSKKKLAARTLNVGLARISIDPSKLSEIKEAITKQDIRDLVSSGAIRVKPEKGRRKSEKRKRRGMGKVKKTIKGRKRKYMILTRKLRGYVNELRKQEKISQETFHTTRKQIKAGTFKSKAHLKELLKQ
jgi:large subunit ribosomal protein L19e